MNKTTKGTPDSIIIILSRSLPFFPQVSKCLENQVLLNGEVAPKAQAHWRAQGSSQGISSSRFLGMRAYYGYEHFNSNMVSIRVCTKLLHWKKCFTMSPLDISTGSIARIRHGTYFVLDIHKNLYIYFIQE